MGILFPNSDEYPDYIPFPRWRPNADGAVAWLAIAGTAFGLCPIMLEEHGHPIHGDDTPTSYRVSAIAVSSSSDLNIEVPAERLSIKGHAPTVAIAASSTQG